VTLKTIIPDTIVASPRGPNQPMKSEKLPGDDTMVVAAAPFGSALSPMA
jgi:hypothetical protein